MCVIKKRQKKMNMRRTGAGRRKDRQGAVWGWASARKRREGGGGGGVVMGSKTIYNRCYVYI